VIRRFINSDNYELLPILSETVGQLNLYAYCGNNPVAYTDPTGLWIETVFDLFSLGVSVVEVVINPANLWNWAGLVGDAVDLLPLVTGVGEGVKSTKLVKYTDSMLTFGESLPVRDRPIYRLHSFKGEEIVRSSEMAAPEEASVCGKRTGVCTCKYQVTG